MLHLSNFHGYQHKFADFMFDGADSYGLADVGSGKTASILTALQRKRDEGQSRRTLIVGPPRVAQTVWPLETADWSHLHGSYNVLPATGSPAQRYDLIASGEGDAVSLSYDNLVWFYENFKHAKQHPFDGVVFDEIDMMCNISSNRFKKMKFYIKNFNTRIGCTATFTSTGLLNVWAQMYLLDRGEALGTSFNRFQNKYFYAIDFNAYNWEPHNFAEEEILTRIALITHRVDSSASKRNKPIERNVAVQYDESVLKLDRKLKKDLVLRFGEYKVVANNQAALAGKRQQIAAGFVYAEEYKNELPTGKRKTIWLDKSKFDELDWLVAQHPNEPILVIYAFTAQGEELKRRYPAAPVKIDAQTIHDWNANKIPLAGAHPASMSHGINMQKGGARIIVYLTPPWTNRRYTQVNGRLNRQGNPYDDILIYRLLADRTNDYDALDVLEHREFQDEFYLKEVEKYCDKSM